MIEVLKSGTFEVWFRSLRDRRAQARINARIRRLSLGNPGDVKPVGSGVSEMRVDCGPGYRVYFVQRDRALALLRDRDCEGLEEMSVIRKRPKKETFSRWDAADYLKSEEDMAAYLQACFEEAREDPALIAAALGDIARARGMVRLAKATGLTREGLYKALSKDGNPRLGTVLKVLKALGLKLTPQVA